MTTGQVSNRDWTTKALLGVIAVCLVVICGWQLLGTSRIKLREMIIVDDAGRERIALSVGERGPAIMFFDEQSKPRIELILQDREPSSVPSLNLLDLEGGRPVMLQSIPGRHAGECSSSLILRGTKGITSELSADKWARLELSEKRIGGASMEMMCVPRRGVFMSTLDCNGKNRFNLETNGKGAAALEILDSNEKTIWKAP